MNKRLLMWFAVPTILMAASFFVFLRWTPPRINDMALAEIQEGMLRTEVETILNCPGRKWRSLTAQTGKQPTIVVEWLDSSRFPDHGRFRDYAWVTDEMLIAIQFDADDRVLQKSAHTGNFDAGLLARIRRAIRAWF